jgi:hypothetical protein
MSIFVILIVAVFLGLFVLMSLPINTENTLSDNTDTKLPES